MLLILTRFYTTLKKGQKIKTEFVKDLHKLNINLAWFKKYFNVYFTFLLIFQRVNRLYIKTDDGVWLKFKVKWYYTVVPMREVWGAQSCKLQSRVMVRRLQIHCNRTLAPCFSPLSWQTPKSDVKEWNWKN